LAGQVFDRAADLSRLWFTFLEYRDVDYALILAASQLRRFGDLRRQEGGIEGVVMHRHVAKGFLALALDDIGGHGGDAQAGSK